MTDSSKLRLANLLLSAVNLQEGQCIYVKCEPVHWDFVNLLAGQAYRRGAKYVYPEIQHAGLHKARVDHSREEFLSYVPDFRPQSLKEVVDEQWVRITISGQAEPDLLASLDSSRSGIARKALAKSDAPFLRAVQADRIRWVVTALPTPGWAAKVFGVAPTQEAEDRLWEVLEPIFRLDQDDPIRAWAAHSKNVARRQKRLMELNLDSIRFVGPGTDLTVGLPANAVWLGGGGHSPDGLWFLSNLPTEEIFTTPDFKRTSGEVALTRPALVMDRPVVGARFTFENGRAVKWSADEGEGVLTELFAIDDKAAYLGELALVDAASPIFKSGLMFHNTLLDENAACHIAFGSSYPGGIRGGEDMDAEAYAAAGGNVSAVHTDVMIGAPEVDIEGVTRDGHTVPIMTGGAWAV